MYTVDDEFETLYY